MILATATALSASDPQALRYEAELFAIYHVKARLKEAQIAEPPPDEESEIAAVPAFVVPYEALTYEGMTLEFQYEQEYAEVTYQDVHLRFYCDLGHKRIIDLVYLSH